MGLQYVENDVTFSAKSDLWVCRVGTTTLPLMQKRIYGFAGWGKNNVSFSAQTDVWVCRMGKTMLASMQKRMYGFAGWEKRF